MQIFDFDTRTKEIIRREMISIPHLKCQSSRQAELSLIPWQDGLLLWHDDLLLRDQIFKGENESPVKVAFTG